MLLTSLFESRTTLENPALSLSDPDTWRDVLGGMRSETEEQVTVERALTLSPVWQAVKMISGDCSKIPLKTYRRRRDSEGKDVDRKHAVWPLINIDGKANEITSSLQLWRRYYASALLWENGYIWIDRDGTGNVHGLYNLLPDRTTQHWSGGKLWYVSEIGGRLQKLPADDVLHLVGLCWDGQPAPELVRQARHDFGLALAARKFTSKFFANGAQHGGILQIPPGSKKESRDKVEQGLIERSKNLDKAFKTMVLRDGYKWFSTTVEPQKAQLLELDEAQVRNVARWFLLAPSRLGIKDSISYNSEEAAKQDYHDTCLSYWLTANQAECNGKLLTEQQRSSRSHVIRYQINALLWADAKTRSEIAEKGIAAGRFSPDETRDWEGLNPRPDELGHQFWRPLNMSVAGETPADETPAEEKDENDTRDQRDEAHAALIRETAARAIRRLATHANRAAKHGVLPTEQAILDQRQAVQEMLAGPVAAWSEHMGTTSLTAERLAEQILHEATTAVRHAKEQGHAFAEQVAQSLAELELRLQAALFRNTDH